MNSTELLHNIPVDPLTGSISTPVYQTSTFVQEAPGINKGYDYARTGNPTRKVLENLIAKLENGHSGYAFATGLAAIDGILKLLSAGDEIVAVDDIYGGSFRLFTRIYEKFDIHVRYVDSTNPLNVANAISNRTKLVWLESPTNPTLKISDIKAIADIAQGNGAYLVVDNTFATPVAQKPLDLGADIVVHSGTKYLGGHSDLVAGLVVVGNDDLAEEIKFIQNASGGILGPWDCFLAIRGIETLDLRFRKQCENAFLVAAYLQHHPEVADVYYPGFSDHVNHEIAKSQQNDLYGGIVSFTLKDDRIETANKIVSSTTYFKLAESLGGVKSLICHPPQMTHASMPRHRRLQSGIKDSLIRLSCGIEEASDLINDLEKALSRVYREEQLTIVNYSED